MAKKIIILGGDSVEQNVAENVSTWSYNANTDVGPIFPDQNITYTLSGADAQYFNIDKNTGVVTLKVAADYEVKSSYDVVITATHVSGGKDTQELQIEVQNVNDNAPDIQIAAQVAIDENTAAVTTATATDADGTLNPLTYSLGGADAALFNIDSATGKLSFKSEPDYETSAHEYNVEVTVSDGTFSDTQAVTVTVNNVNDNAPVLADEAAAIDENSAAGTVIAKLAATDADGDLTPLTYSLAAGGTGDGLFTVAADGTVSVAAGAALDYETAQSYTLNVQVNDGAHTSTAVITVNLNDVYEAPPVPVTPTEPSGTTDPVVTPSDPTTVTDYNMIHGDKNNNTLTGTDAADKILGQAGDDVLIGGGGADVLMGHDGKDILSGGSGDDVLSGFKGADTFSFDASKDEGADVITDFSRTDGDKINIANATSVTVDNTSQDSVITVNSTSTITVQNTDIDITKDITFNNTLP